MRPSADHAPDALDYDDALATVLADVRPLPPAPVDLDRAVGLILAEELRADRDQPACHRARLDGYALRRDDLHAGVAIPVHAIVRAGDREPDAPPAGTCLQVATGAPVPEPLDLVVEHERTDRGDPVLIDAPSHPAAMRGIHQRASDATLGETLVPAGTMIDAGVIAVAATIGAARVRAIPAPRVAILGTGDELVAVDDAVAPHQVRDANGPMLAALAASFGGSVVARERAPDDLDATIDALARLVSTSDVVVTIGGVSAGERDHLPAAFDALEARSVLRQARIQPGKPIRVVECSARAGGPPVRIVALPGNPVSAFATAHLFLRPLLARLSGRADAGTDPRAAWRAGTLAGALHANPNRRAFRSVRFDANGALAPLTTSGSGDVSGVAAIDGLVDVAPNAGTLDPGTIVRFLPVRDPIVTRLAEPSR